MGNQLASEVYFDELPEGYTIVQQLGKSRFLKTLQCSCVDGQLVVKAYIKNTDEDSSLIQKYQNELKAIHTQIQYYVNPNVLTFQTFDQNDKAGYMMRQYIHNNLYERMHTRPFLIDIEKLWLTYQLMKAVERCHFFGISHRDIKTENVLVTSWNWLYLTDFAPYKPTYIPEDNPANFYYFYDSCERRKCCIAPERYYTGEIPQEVEEYDLAKMDVFSLGCTIAELWIESGLFTYSELIQYKRGTYDPQSKISKISNPTIQNMVRIMIEKDKTLRPSVTDP
uniref:Protein kinase domain-containing protein n=1 Tax=Arcella intermedia TaxID=1963864 RepID=A0A6B2LCU2_9EUKA